MSTNYPEIFQAFCKANRLPTRGQDNWLRLTDISKRLDRWQETMEMVAYYKTLLADQAQRLTNNVNDQKDKFNKIIPHWAEVRYPVEKMMQLYVELDHWENEREFITDQTLEWMEAVEETITMADI